MRPAWHRDRLAPSAGRGCRFPSPGPVGEDNQISRADGGQAVRDDDGRAIGLQAVERRTYRLLAEGIEMRGRLVEDQHRCVLEEGPRDGDALTLAA